jgi:glycosyltransferase involved in cell wall biosynthesis
MDNPSVCYVASHAINNALEGHNIASIRIIEAAVGAGIDAKVVSLEGNSVCSKRNFYPIKSFLKVARKTSNFPSVWEIFSSFPAMLKAKNLNCDIIHLLNITKEVFILSNKLVRTKAPCITHFFHSDFPFSAYASFKMRSLLLKLGTFNHILSSNRSLVDYLINELRLDANSAIFIPFPVDINRFRPRNKQKLREKYDIPANAQIIAYIGAIDSDRGFFFLLKAFKKIIQQMPKATFYICHPNLKEEMTDLLNRLVMSQKVKDNISVHGPNPSIEDVYSLADVIALPFQKPYWITAPPLVLLEAMASGTPIVTTPVDVIGEIGDNMVDMIFTTPGDLGSLVNAVVYALENQDEAEDIGVRARENAVKNFSMEVVGKKLRETYKRICES